MPVKLFAYNDDETLMIYEFNGIWTIAEFSELDKDLWNRFHETTERIDIIYDLTDSEAIPSGILELANRAGERVASSARGLNLVVNVPTFGRIILGGMRRLYPHLADIYRIASTRQEAVDLIYADRSVSSTDDM